VDNTGNTSILETDVESPIRIDLGSAGYSLAPVSETVPSGIKASVAHNANILTIQHGLLNSGDRLVVELISDGEPSLAADAVTGRVAGVSRINAEDRSVAADTGAEPYYGLSSRGAGVLLVVVAVAMAVLAWICMRESGSRCFSVDTCRLPTNRLRRRKERSGSSQRGTVAALIVRCCHNEDAYLLILTDCLDEKVPVRGLISGGN